MAAAVIFNKVGIDAAPRYDHERRHYFFPGGLETFRHQTQADWLGRYPKDEMVCFLFDLKTCGRKERGLELSADRKRQSLLYVVMAPSTSAQLPNLLFSPQLSIASLRARLGSNAAPLVG